MKRIILSRFGELWLLLPNIVLIILGICKPNLFLKNPAIVAIVSHEILSLQALVLTVALGTLANFYLQISRIETTSLASPKVASEKIEKLHERIGHLKLEIKAIAGSVVFLFLITAILVFSQDIKILNVPMKLFSFVGAISCAYIYFYFLYELFKGQILLADILASIREIEAISASSPLPKK